MSRCDKYPAYALMFSIQPLMYALLVSSPNLYPFPDSPSPPHAAYANKFAPSSISSHSQTFFHNSRTPSIAIKYPSFSVRVTAAVTYDLDASSQKPSAPNLFTRHQPPYAESRGSLAKVRVTGSPSSIGVGIAIAEHTTPFLWMRFSAATLQRHCRARLPHERCKRDPSSLRLVLIGESASRVRARLHRGLALHINNLLPVDLRAAASSAAHIITLNRDLAPCNTRPRRCFVFENGTLRPNPMSLREFAIYNENSIWRGIDVIIDADNNTLRPAPLHLRLRSLPVYIQLHANPYLQLQFSAPSSPYSLHLSTFNSAFESRHSNFPTFGAA
ncbi:hypothetical protein C8R44DRAFT_747068 [Mycena epipterygia]|nr:hypothetical protein C8R44DRAFT_747068 [Mycena epipterygia]